MTDRTIQERIQRVAETTVLTALPPDSDVTFVASIRTGDPKRWMVNVDAVTAGTKVRYSGYGFDTGTVVAVDLNPVHLPDPFEGLI